MWLIRLMLMREALDTQKVPVVFNLVMDECSQPPLSPQHSMTFLQSRRPCLWAIPTPQSHPGSQFTAADGFVDEVGACLAPEAYQWTVR